MMPLYSWADTIIVDLAGNGDTGIIQQGIGMAAPGDTVLVLAGFYRETITIKSGVTLLSDAGASSTIIDGQGESCIAARGCAAGTRVIGFTLTNSRAFQGGGVLAVGNTSIEVAHNLIIGNDTEFGGAGVWVQRFSHASIHHNRFEKLSSKLGAAIAVVVNSSADIHDNVFINNTSTSLAAAIGVHQSHATVVNNFFLDNTSGDLGGTIDFYKATGHVFNNTFIGNTSSVEGAGGVAVRSKDCRIAIGRNLFSNLKGGPALRTETCQEVSCNIFWQNDIDHAGACQPIDQGGNVVVDPMLIPAAGGHVAPESPCWSIYCGPVGVTSVSK